jgi:hypothetical protein
MSDLKGLVKPLEWHDLKGVNKYAIDPFGGEYQLDGNDWTHDTMSGWLGGGIEAAQAHCTDQILAALALAKVEALAEAAEIMVKAYREESDKVITAFYALEDALAAMKGGDT